MLGKRRNFNLFPPHPSTASLASLPRIDTFPSRGRLGRCDAFNNKLKQSKNPCFFINQPPKERHNLASFVQREVARLAVTEGLLKAQGHLIRLAGSAPSPTGEGLGDVMLSTIVLNKAKVLAFYQSTAKRTA